jgi:hypothetical protein
MPGGSDRPYFKSSIAQLEGLFEDAKADAETLRMLDQELGRRRTERASRLRSMVAEALAALHANPGTVAPSSRVNGGTPIINGTAAETIFRKSFTPLTAVQAASNAASVPNSLGSAQIEDLGGLPALTPPTGSNKPRAILAAWTALEALSPQTYRRPEDLAGGDRRCVADLSTGSIPWGSRERSRLSRLLYYRVVLGSIPMGQATEDLVKAFGEDEEGTLRVGEKAAIGVVLVDRDGIVVEENGVAASSFAWALPLALKLRLGALGAWPKIEPKIIEQLDGIVRRSDRDGNPIPLDLHTIDEAYRWLVAQFELPAHLVEPPTFALRVYHYFKAKTPPEALLLNSFFLGDLGRGAERVRENAVPAGLRHYLSIEKPIETFDLLQDKDALEKAVSPAMTPAARWPTRGGFPLVMLQQAAVNLARSELAGGEGIIAVNGPPGTGKTTLLRDVVAACVLDRALAMTAFKDPEKAFTPSGQRISAGPHAFFQLYALDQSLKGHEILVASSNNKAVENISKELPALGAIGRSTDELCYFKSVSNLVHGLHESAGGNDDKEIAPNPVETWGLIAAVLGNAGNRAAFRQSFWWDEDRSFRLYLKAAKGDPVIREIKDPKTGRIIERKTPSVVLDERPPSPTVAKTDWQAARERLLALKREVSAELIALEEKRQLCIQLAQACHDVAREEANASALVAQQPELDANTGRCRDDLEIARGEHARRAGDVLGHRQSRPSFFPRLLQTERWKVWRTINVQKAQAEAGAADLLRAREQAFSGATAAQAELTGKIRKAEESLAAARERVTQLSQTVDALHSQLGDRLVDARLFERGHEAINLIPPWIPDSLHRKREDLFIAALAVHRAFIDASAQKILHNLSVLMDVFSSGPFQDQAKRRLLGDLWSTLFLVVPVISTTFASVERMLGELLPGSIGWLLIDEAGQALPQAAVGAIMRSKRSIVVGDPLQVPPVVTLPERLNLEICRFFKVDGQVWSAPEASAQTLADQASRFQAAFRSRLGQRRVGVPLLVHRRCQEPMFGMSNRIAYDGQMVLASRENGTGPIGAILGPSKWLDVDGEANSKWCPAEGDLVVALLKRLAEAGVTAPDLFIITPFRIVAHEMRRRLERESRLLSELGVDANEWPTDHVGTIHTVQGREANAVIFVLGAPRASQNGARGWAAGTPNILNVAVSRAKQNLYVVGSRGAWSGIGHARELASMQSLRV